MLQIVLHLSAWLCKLSQQLKLSMQMMMCGTDDDDEGAAAAVLLLYKSKQSSAQTALLCLKTCQHCAYQSGIWSNVVLAFVFPDTVWHTC